MPDLSTDEVTALCDNLIMLMESRARIDEDIFATRHVIQAGLKLQAGQTKEYALGSKFTMRITGTGGAHTFQVSKRE